MNKDWVETLEDEEGWRRMPNKVEGCPNFKPYTSYLDDVFNARRDELLNIF
jgi:hypothetical protein